MSMASYNAVPRQHAAEDRGVFAPDGKMIGRIMPPERCANVCFGGRKRNRLFIAASQSVYSLRSMSKPRGG